MRLHLLMSALLLLSVGCLSSVIPDGDPAPALNGGNSPTGNGGSGGGGGGGASPGATSYDFAVAVVSDMAIAPLPKPSDLAMKPAADLAAPATSAACKTLSDCCALLDSSTAMMCQNAVAKADDATCQNILDQLQQNGVCN